MWHTCLALSEPHGTPKGSQESARSWGFLSCQKQKGPLSLKLAKMAVSHYRDTCMQRLW